VWITHDIKWIQHPTGNEETTEQVNPSVMSDIVIDVEIVPEVETVPDNDDEEENDAINHGAPADKDDEMNNNAGSVASMKEDDDIDPCILCQMKKLGGWFNPDAEEYIARAHKAAEDSEVNVNNDEGKWLMPRSHMCCPNLLSTVPRKRLKNEKRRMEKSTILWSLRRFVRHTTTRTRFNKRSGMRRFKKNSAT